MIAILVHFLGHLLVDSAIPPWVGSADAYVLAMWFAGFALVDLIACALADSKMLRSVLALSFAWSAALAVEQSLIQDWMHGSDQIVQVLIDTTLIGFFVAEIFGLRSRKRSQA